MPEVVFAVGGVGDFVPGEICAAAGAGLADGVEEVHCDGTGLGDGLL